MATVFLAMPGYAGVHARAARAFWGCPTNGKHRCLPSASGGSLLAQNFNNLWWTASEVAKERELDYFVMLHSDVAPEPGWVDVLVSEIERTGADVVSAVIPIKDRRGLTSTAIEDTDCEWSPLRRLTMTEVIRLPETFGIADLGYTDGRALLVNTGCWIADLRKPWAFDRTDPVTFTIRDRVRFNDSGKPCCDVVPEDWNFSRWLHRKGCVVKATRAVPLHHFDGASSGYPNDTPWGEWQDDRAYAEKHLGIRLPLAGAGLAVTDGGGDPLGTGEGQDGAGDRELAGAFNDLHGSVG